MTEGKRWTVRDRFGNAVYLTHERWQHIIEPINHPEMADFEEHLAETVRSGKRRQDPFHPRKYRYVQSFKDLVGDNTHLVAMVLFRAAESPKEKLLTEGFVVTAYQKEIG
ncbi:MAG: hypothetical protein HYV26_18355 [Candidatus Hydrogenedentes bacterium]|nr:hypothetical protein [Candidatus Hydrogenedentota bacterium]